MDKLKDRIRELTRRTRGRHLEQIVAELRNALLGWTGVCACKTCIPSIHGGQSNFGIAEVMSSVRDIDKWI